MTIIGAGVLGLFTAYDLLEKGFTNITIVAAEEDGLTSHNAGGLLAPVSMDNAPEIQKMIDSVGIDAYKFYAQIAQKKHPHFKKGAIIVPAYFENRSDSGLEPYVGKVMNPPQDVVVDFGNGTKRLMVVYADGIFMQPYELMAEMTCYLKKNGVTFVKQKITSFDALSSKYIINCAGLGAAELTQDDQMVPVQGHLLMLKNQNPAHLNYMLLVYGKTITSSSGHSAKLSTYLFPKQYADAKHDEFGVLGGTFVEGATPDTPNNELFDVVLKDARRFYGVSEKTKP